jgi:hypothetical protein
MIIRRFAVATILIALCLAQGLAQGAAAEEPVAPAQMWLVPNWQSDERGRSEVFILNASGAEASVTCHVYTERGVRVERASQTKTYAAGASRSNEGGSLPCALTFAGATRGWAVVVSVTPIIVRAQTCGMGVNAPCTPLEARPVDCRAPAGLEAVCRHAPPLAFILPPDALEDLRERPRPRP